MKGQQVFIAKGETYPALIFDNEQQKHFTTWMQEGKVFERNDCLGGSQLTKPLQLRNGVTMSIQSGGSHYCEPRRNMPYSQYESFEIGFPSAVIDALMPYVDNEDAPTDTVYSNVPMAVIEQIVYNAGGVVGYKGECIENA